MPAQAAEIHTYFFRHREGCGPFRFSRLCYPEGEPPAKEIAEFIRRGGVVSAKYNAVQSVKGSTSGMRTHLQAHVRKGDLQPQAWLAPGNARATPVNDELTEQWIITVLLKNLCPVRLAEDCRRDIPALAGLAGRTALRQRLKQRIRAIADQARAMVQQAQRDGCRFAISIDGWKTKAFTPVHFDAVMLDWCDPMFRRYSCCIGVKPMPPTRDQHAHEQVLRDCIADLGLATGDLVAGLSDHEGAVRCSIRNLQTNVVGCGCHFVQLAAKHALPPARKRRRKAAGAHSSSAGSSSSDTTSDTSRASAAGPAAGAAAGAAGPAAGAAAKKRTRTDPDVVAIREITGRWCKRFRGIVNFYKSNDDAVRWLQHDAGAQNPPVPVISWRSEGETRFSGALLAWRALYKNAKAHNITRELRAGGAKKYPEALSRDETVTCLDMCIVMEPLLDATRFLEGDGGTLGRYLPAVHQLRAVLERDALAIPEDLQNTSFGKLKKTRQKSSMAKVAQKLAEFFVREIPKITDKHLSAASSRTVAAMATLMDPRFKAHPCVAQDAPLKERALASIKDWAMQAHRTHGGLVASFAKEDPDAVPIVLRLPPPDAPGKKMRASRGGRRRSAPAVAPIYPAGSAAPAAAPAATAAAPAAATAAAGPAPAAAAAEPAAAAAAAAAPAGAGSSPLRRSARILARRESDEKTRRMNAFIFGAAPAAAAAPAGPVEDLGARVDVELDAWLGVPPEEDVRVSPFDYWLARRGKYPLLATVAMWLLSIPASTAALERLFSAAGRGITRRRPRLDPETSAGLIFGHANVERGVDGDVGDAL